MINGSIEGQIMESSLRVIQEILNRISPSFPHFDLIVAGVISLALAGIAALVHHCCFHTPSKKERFRNDVC
jgi:hypothetical protein